MIYSQERPFRRTNKFVEDSKINFYFFPCRLSTLHGTATLFMVDSFEKYVSEQEKKIHKMQQLNPRTCVAINWRRSQSNKAHKS